MITLKLHDPFFVIKREILKHLTVFIGPDLEINLFTLGMIYEIDLAEAKGITTINILLTPNNRCHEKAIVNSVTHSALKHLGDSNVVVNLLWSDDDADNTLINEIKKQYA